MVFSGVAVFCPECNSDHVIQLAGQTAPSTSTPVPCGYGQNGDGCFKFDYIDTHKVYVAGFHKFKFYKRVDSLFPNFICCFCYL